VASEPEALRQVLTNTIYCCKRVGLEAGPLSQWLYSVLAEAGLPVMRLPDLAVLVEPLLIVRGVIRILRHHHQRHAVHRRDACPGTGALLLVA